MPEEDTPTDSTKSEWNEQQLFAQLFFDLTRSCRYYQSKQAVKGWKSVLESKMSLVMGVANEKEKEHLDFVRDEIIKKAFEDRNLPPEKQGKLFNLLFYAEAEIDTIACDHMPFLKIKKQTDIGGM